MRTFQEIKDNYRLTDAEMERLRSLLPLVEPHAEQLVNALLPRFPANAGRRQVSPGRGPVGQAHDRAPHLAAGPVPGAL